MKLPFFNRPAKPKKKKGPIREWLDAIIFAAIAAQIIRTFVLEPFMIPTASMERSLMVGDFLFVSKFHYGARLPMVPLSIPFIHNRLPLTDTKSYLDWIKFPYMRLPGISDIERNDVVVFNYPAEDVHPNNPKMSKIVIPSMKENYIKRCVAVPGDLFEIRGSQVYINGKKGTNPPEMQYRYRVYTNEPFNPKVLEEYGFRMGMENRNWEPSRFGPYFEFYMPDYLAEEMKTWKNVVKIERSPGNKIPPQNNVNDPNNYFGFDVSFKGWSLDDFGPLKVPKEGMSIQLTMDNLPHYQRIIEMYEGHKLEVKGRDIYIDNKMTNEYTFEMDYYFMMGDNRYNSQDSRFWGFVPIDHVVGKPLFVFFSKENGIRWNRIFKIIE